MSKKNILSYFKKYTTHNLKKTKENSLLRFSESAMVREHKRPGKLLVGLIFDCGVELKLAIAALLLFCCLLTFLQFVPTCFFPFYYPKSPSLEAVLKNGVIKRTFDTVGVAAYNFVLMSAYRSGPNSFAINGLSSKPLHVFGNPTYNCEYRSHDNVTVPGPIAPGYVIIPDFGFGRVYTTVIITCTFDVDIKSVSNAGVGGRLLLHASVNGGYDTKVNTTDTVLALTESPNSWDISKFTNSTYKYDYFYCGSPLYGQVSPQRVREWIAYHVRLFGERSHFAFYDAGGVHKDVMEVLKPWIELGYVTVEDVREQERFDAYYYNQFLTLNDCLHRYRFSTRWMFFFDVDEFVYLTAKDGSSFADVMESLEGFTQFTFEQMPMSDHLCSTQDAHNASKKWGMEKLVYKSVKHEQRNRKYAIQPRNVFAAGVHMTMKLKGETSHNVRHLLKYFHYHGTVAVRREPCRRFIDKTSIKVNNTPYVLDTRMKSIAPLVKSFELSTIGSRLELTKQ
ncbi:hypothetical protein RND81_01G072200 [Saponaria officinalis]|uniref:Glycosyltransferase family 92 protein n=1 Tax=Saponaria officinalis TaxID=3572 RepID=A0AAW1N958_SAPOF